MDVIEQCASSVLPVSSGAVKVQIVAGLRADVTLDIPAPRAYTNHLVAPALFDKWCLAYARVNSEIKLGGRAARLTFVAPANERV